jgi:hypothetical protein
MREAAHWMTFIVAARLALEFATRYAQPHLVPLAGAGVVLHLLFMVTVRRH